MAELLPWLLAALAGAVAFGMFLRVRSAAVEAASGQLEAEKLRGELASTREQLGRAEAKLRRRADESQELRKKVDKLKRRSAQQGGPQKGRPAGRIPELEAELEQTRQARDAAREEAAGVASELSRLRAEAGASATAPKPLLDNDAIEALQARAASLEQSLSEVRAEVDEKAKAVARMKSKLSTQEQLYVSMRGELAAKKDRLRTQQEEIERLMALKVAVIDPTPADADEAAPSAERPAGADDARDVEGGASRAG